MVARKPSKLSAFADFLEKDHPLNVTSFEDMMALHAAWKASALANFIKGKPMSEVLQGGAEIKAKIILSDPNRLDPGRN